MQNNNNQAGRELDSFFRTSAQKMNTEVGSMGNSSTIDSKDLSIIEDQMYKEALLYKKCTTYAGYFNDQSLKTMANTAAEHHKKHFETLHGYLNASK